MNISQMKAITVTVGGVLSSFLGILYIPVLFFGSL